MKKLFAFLLILVLSSLSYGYFVFAPILSEIWWQLQKIMPVETVHISMNVAMIAPILFIGFVLWRRIGKGGEA